MIFLVALLVGVGGAFVGARLLTYANERILPGAIRSGVWRLHRARILKCFNYVPSQPELPPTLASFDSAEGLQSEVMTVVSKARLPVDELRAFQIDDFVAHARGRAILPDNWAPPLRPETRAISDFLVQSSWVKRSAMKRKPAPAIGEIVPLRDIARLVFVGQ